MGSLWRRSIWQDAGHDINAVAHELDCQVRPLWCGYGLRTDEVRVEWVGGLRGLRTRFRVGQRRFSRPGWLNAQEVLRCLGTQT